MWILLYRTDGWLILATRVGIKQAPTSQRLSCIYCVTVIGMIASQIPLYPSPSHGEGRSKLGRDKRRGLVVLILVAYTPNWYFNANANKSLCSPISRSRSHLSARLWCLLDCLALHGIIMCIKTLSFATKPIKIPIIPGSCWLTMYQRKDILTISTFMSQVYTWIIFRKRNIHMMMMDNLSYFSLLSYTWPHSLTSSIFVIYTMLVPINCK